MRRYLTIAPMLVVLIGTLLLVLPRGFANPHANRVRVVVILKDPLASRSNPVDDETRQALVAQAEDNFLAKLAPYKVTVTKRLTNLPQIGLIIDTDTLENIRSWPEVLSIERDELSKPAVLPRD